MDVYETLIAKVQAPSLSQAERREAFGELVNRFQNVAYSWAYSMLGDGHLAQEATQEAFITAYTHLGQLREAAAFPGWLKRIVLTWCSRLTRRKQAALYPFEDFDGSWPDPSTEFEDREWRELLDQAIRALPEGERTVTELFYLADYSQQEIAEQLEVPVTTVKKRLQYAREHLNERLRHTSTFAVDCISGELMDQIRGEFGWLLEDILSQTQARGLVEVPVQKLPGGVSYERIPALAILRPDLLSGD